MRKQAPAAVSVERDGAAVQAHELGRDRQAEAGAAGAAGALEGGEQVRARALRDAGAVVVDT